MATTSRATASYRDAMISARYAYNLAHRGDLSWNPADRIEGFTNLGWTLVMSLPHWFGVELGWAPLFPLLVNAALHGGVPSPVEKRNGAFFR